jgi:hypothetical protein
VTVAPVIPKRRLLTAGELAQRWRVSEERALMFLTDFEARGYAERRGGYWRATRKALALQPFDGDPV